jgi:hypothetical protein
MKWGTAVRICNDSNGPFCNLNTSSLPVELPQKIMPYVMFVWMCKKVDHFQIIHW